MKTDEELIAEALTEGTKVTVYPPGQGSAEERELADREARRARHKRRMQNFVFGRRAKKFKARLTS